jgi:hypothetical protein
MKKYGKTRFTTENGFSVIELLETDAAGRDVLTGFVVRCPDGTEHGPFGSYDGAVEECDSLAEEQRLRPPRP